MPLQHSVPTLHLPPTTPQHLPPGAGQPRPMPHSDDVWQVPPGPALQTNCSHRPEMQPAPVWQDAPVLPLHTVLTHCPETHPELTVQGSPFGPAQNPFEHTPELQMLFWLPQGSPVLPMQMAPLPQIFETQSPPLVHARPGSPRPQKPFTHFKERQSVARPHGWLG